MVMDEAPPLEALSLDPLLAACCRWMAALGWTAFSLRHVADQEKLPLEVLEERFSSPEAVIEAFFQHIDACVAHRADVPLDSSVKEKVVESLMLRFECLRPFRPLTVRLYEDSFRAPCLGVLLLQSITRSLENRLKSLGLEPSWMSLASFVWLYGVGFQAWRNDDTPDLSKTLFTLDQQFDAMGRYLPFMESFHG